MPTPRNWTENLDERRGRAPDRLRCCTVHHEDGRHEDGCPNVLEDFANPECHDCGGAGVVSAGDPCPECIVGVWL